LHWAVVLQIAPKDDETKALQAYGGPVNELSAPEQFLLAMSTVPRLTDKLNILILILQFKVILPPSSTFCNAIGSINARQFSGKDNQSFLW